MQAWPHRAGGAAADSASMQHRRAGPRRRRRAGRSCARPRASVLPAEAPQASQAGQALPALGCALVASAEHRAAWTTADAATGLLTVPLVDAAADDVPLSVSLLLARAGEAAPLDPAHLSHASAPEDGHVLTLLLAGGAVATPRGAPAVPLAPGDCWVWEGRGADPGVRPASAPSAAGWALAAVQFHLLGAAAAAPRAASAAQPLRGEEVRSALSACVAGLRAADAARPAPRAPRAAFVRSLASCDVFAFPEQSNRLALLVDPLGEPLATAAGCARPAAFTFGVESFEAGHVTELHTHPASHELFLILSGRGRANCGAHSRAVGPGDCVIFPPHSLHGLDVDAGEPMLVLELMLPDDGFASYVRSGTAKASLLSDAAVTHTGGFVAR